MNSADTKVKGKRTGEQGSTLNTESKGGIPAIGSNKSEPREVYAKYKGNAEEVVTREKIPKEYKTLVKDYFKEIDPSR